MIRPERKLSGMQNDFFDLTTDKYFFLGPTAGHISALLVKTI